MQFKNICISNKLKEAVMYQQESLWRDRVPGGLAPPVLSAPTAQTPPRWALSVFSWAFGAQLKTDTVHIINSLCSIKVEFVLVFLIGSLIPVG